MNQTACDSLLLRCFCPEIAWRSCVCHQATHHFCPVF